MLTAQPSLSELYVLISKVPKYPLSKQRLLELASETGAPKEVIRFYKVFADDLVFDDEEDLAGRTEQIQIMHRDKGEMPAEEFRAPEED